MSREDAIKVEGTVVEMLPNTLYQVALPNGHQIHGHLSRPMRANQTRLLPGDRVVVEMSPYDFSKGCITYRQK